jgi:uncharacterized phage protein gp47/JayE
VVIADDAMYRRADEILADMLAALQAAVADAYVGDDGAINIIFRIEASQFENLYLANQLLLEDSFVSTATFQALRRHGEQYGLAMQDGTVSVGSLTITGGGGTYVPIGTEVAYDPGAGLDPVYFDTTLDGTIPDPGTPLPPTAAINATAGNLNGLYEYVVTFVTASGETVASAESNAVSPATQQVNLTAIPVGGPGTTARRIYRALNGSGIYRRITEIANNTATTFTDNVTDAVMNAGSLVPTVDTAHSITVTAQSQQTGVEGNVAAGSITELTNAPATLTDVLNTAAFTGGSDPENTEDFRARVLDAIQNPQTGSAADLKAWAENVAGVGTATVFPNTPAAGQTTVRITAENGGIPDSTLLAQVQAELDSRDLANITIIVASFTQTVENVTVDVTTSGTYTLADVTPQVQQAITDYINGLDIGQTLMVAGIIDAVFGLAGIADVVVTTPATNQTIASDHKWVPGTITVT